MPDADEDGHPQPLAVEGRPIYSKIVKSERAGDKNALEPAWKEHWEELRVDMITALTPALASTSRKTGLRDIPSSFSPMENNKIAYRVFYFQLCRP